MHIVNYAATEPADWTALLDRARSADAAGVDRLIVSDHVVFGEHLEEYGRPEAGGVEGGKQPTGPDGLWLEPMTLLSVLAGLTTHVLDVTSGGPAPGVRIELFEVGDDGARRLVVTTATNADGRTDAPLIAAAAARVGKFEIDFHAGD